jgi:hypothetical protein
LTTSVDVARSFCSASWSKAWSFVSSGGGFVVGTTGSLRVSLIAMPTMIADFARRGIPPKR